MNVEPWDMTKQYRPGQQAVIKGKVCAVWLHGELIRPLGENGCYFCPSLNSSEMCDVINQCNRSIGSTCVWVDPDAMALARLKGQI